MTKQEFDRLTIEDTVTDGETTFGLLEIYRADGVVMAKDHGTYDFADLEIVYAEDLSTSVVTHENSGDWY